VRVRREENGKEEPGHVGTSSSLAAVATSKLRAIGYDVELCWLDAIGYDIEQKIQNIK
jgi:hypothetical protein